MSNDSAKKYKTLARDTVLFTISSFGSKILVFLLTPLYTSILATSEYGVADLINTTIHFIYPILTLAITDATLRYALDKENDKNEVFCLSTIFILLSVIILLLIKPIICLIDSSMQTYWYYFVANYALFNIHNYFANFVKGLGKTKLFAIQGLLHTLSIIICNIIFLVVLKVGLNGYLLSVLIGYMIPIVLMFFGARLHNYLFPFKVNRTLLADMLKYSIPMIPTLLAWTINTSIDKYMIIWQHGLDANGIYSVAHKIPTIITTILSVFIQAWQISVISNHGSNDESKFYTDVYKGLDLISISGCMFVILICKPLAKLLFANDFYEAWQCVPMLVLAAMFSSHSGFLAAAYRAAKKTKQLFVSVLIGAIINVVFNLLLIKPLGILGAAIATVASFFLVWLVRVVLIQKIVKVDIPVIPTCVSYILIFLSSILVTYEFRYSGIVLIASYIVICFIKRDIIATLLQNSVRLIKSHRHH